ncbi:cryptochrome/photolyase family protein [Roseomonas xinghualingensis]|uniref:cryptochrome/photolyase family protein n=1 Tax=Roseomonas xinghualingensis TaxID=2986475 RepID=UPI0021F1FDEA|nr:deoxyribodipyrimidine photo-lyase [Roseomonas sp. SXEYE001]MCV4208143.1 DNA photolyase family protein [Roseomonas sp. SXEYE001]
MTAPCILWFRQDLRLGDNPAVEAVRHGAVLPVFVLDDAAAGELAYGGAARWWLHHSLDALQRDLEARGASLLLLKGDAVALLAELARRTGATAIHAGWLAEPWARAQEVALAERLSADGRRLELHRSSHLLHPASILTGSGRLYTVYAPFARKVLASGEVPPPIDAPDRLNGVTPPAGLSLADLALTPVPPQPNWAAEFGTAWTPGEAGARERLAQFIEDGLENYATRRNEPGVEGSSNLSPHLRWGEISPRQVWHAARGAGGAEALPFLREILWREFSHHLLWHRPEMPREALRAPFASFPFAPDQDLLHAWQGGRTGYPIVDAGMRQLWRIGWMHNRVRMIAASLLVKHLLQPWQDGAAWFMDTLVDADPANNSASWQWIAGSGTDASPYFRVFNPILQGEKFDPEGAYVRRWLPELARMPSRYIHRPYEAPEEIRHAAGVTEQSYPRPVVDHATGRARALAALRATARGPVPEGVEA